MSIISDLIPRVEGVLPKTLTWKVEYLSDEKVRLTYEETVGENVSDEVLINSEKIYKETLQKAKPLLQNTGIELSFKRVEKGFVLIMEGPERVALAGLWGELALHLIRSDRDALKLISTFVALALKFDMGGAGFKKMEVDKNG